MTQGSVASAEIGSIVQAWADGETNHGVTVTAGTTDGWAIHFSGNPDPALRPKLIVTYTTQPVADDCTTSSFTQTVGDPNSVMFWFKTLTTEWIDGNTILPEGAFLDGGTPEDQAMLRFNNIFAADGGDVPDNAIICKATLTLTTSSAPFNLNVGTGGAYGARQVTTDWVGGEAFSALTFGPFVDDAGGLMSDARAEYDVTEILNNWQSGEPNYGFNVASTGTSDGWAIVFPTGPAADVPTLTVEWRLPSFVLGDANGDGLVNNDDIGALVLALLSPADYAIQFPGINADEVLDFTGDGSFDNLDIGGFLAALGL